MKSAAEYRITLTLVPVESETEVRFQLGNTVQTVTAPKGADECRMDRVKLAAGPGKLQVSVTAGQKVSGPRFVEVRKL